MKIKVSIVIVTWNGARYIKECLQSILRQQDINFIKIEDNSSEDEQGSSANHAEIIVIDNDSADETVSIIENNFADYVSLVKQRNNLGFAATYNRGIHWSRGEYILILNQDVVLSDNFLSILISFLDAYEKIGVAIGKVLRCSFPFQPTNIIDSLGLSINSKAQVTDIGAGQVDQGAAGEAVPVFGFSGAVALLRRRALFEAKYNNQFFDEEFVSYKEDVDLSWRLRWLNWDIVYVPEAVAYHHRSARAGKESSGWGNNLAIAKNYLAKPDFINFLSYRNHLFVLIKNLPWLLAIKYGPKIAWYEFKKMVFVAVVKPKIFWQTLRDLIVQLPLLISKRRYIMKRRRIKPKALELWIKQTTSR